MTIIAALAESAREWDRRLAGLRTAQASRSDDAEWWRTLDQSLVGRGVARSAEWLTRATAGSAAARTWRAATGAMLPRARMRSAGVAAIAGALVHIALTGRGVVVGFWWLILPALAMTFGVGACVMSWFVANAGDDADPGR